MGSLRQLKQWIKTTAVMATGIAASCLSTITHGAGLLVPTGSSSSLEMVSHDVDVKLQDGIAMTTVEQVFANPGQSVEDAHYRFPLPDEAAIGQFTYWIAGQPIHGEVVEKQKAQQIYQQEQQQGRKVAMSEQQGYKHFDIRVANLMPGEDVRVKLVYLQKIQIDHGIGRYVYPLEDGGTDEEQKAFWTMQSQVKKRFSFNAKLRSGYPVDAVRVPNQANANIQQLSSQEWTVSITEGGSSLALSTTTPSTKTTLETLKADGEPQGQISQYEMQQYQQAQQEAAEQVAVQNSVARSSNVYQLNNDLVFYWRLQPGTPGGLDVLAYKESANKTGTLMMTLTPGDDLQPIQRGTDWTLLLDISGSMQGKFQTLIEGVKKGLKRFNPQDRVRVVLFNDYASNLTGGFLPATQKNIAEIIRKLDLVLPNGGTHLMDGVRFALSGLDADRTSAIWLVTDGVTNVGETKQRKFVDLLKQKDIRVFTFIMGNGANRPLLKAITKASNGFAINVSNSDDIIGQLEKAASKVTHEALRDIKVRFKGLNVKDVEPTEITSLYRGAQLQLFAHYWQAGKGIIEVTAKRNGTPVRYEVPFTLPEVDTEYPELERMWAFSQIQRLLSEQEDFGESADRKDAVLSLAKEYGLVTPYTNMLVLEEQQFKAYNIKRSNSTRIQKEEQARTQRQQKPIQQRNQAQNHQQLSQPRSTLGGSSGGGSMDFLLIALVVVVLYGRRKMSKLMS
ncbi:VWA domain-containing protein [Bermanella marisrubri]|uniref:Uncharacterized protein n=1 Tax=Bermanella marisrubri TaxID=207949 RepID=Q1N498_9GAMM|nr:VIT and VWA domain-containing protein [Bermanella marisrubri]EAT12967.1 hypothetical protein RED65_14762 [Oceanobacter sp. RED65] [Bermanella marisrubri]QIZ82905.1 VWA domain-containing protein [Bermanella marisrubri]